MDKNTEEKLRRIVSAGIEGIYSDLAAAKLEGAEFDGGDPDPTADDFVEPVVFHMLDEVKRRLPEMYDLVRKFDPEVTAIIRDEARQILGR